MGMGIAQVAATNGHEVCLYDSFDRSIKNAETKLNEILNRLAEKERITEQEKQDILGRIKFSKNLEDIISSGLVVEAIIENLEIKQQTFAEIEKLVEELEDGRARIEEHVSTLANREDELREEYENLVKTLEASK